MADNNEFESIALPHLDAVFKTAFALCGNTHKAEDLAQATFLRAFEQFENFKKGTNCKAWLTKILRNKWIDQLRHKKVVGEVLPIEENIIADTQTDEPVAWSNSRDILENFSDDQVIKALQKVPDEQRLTLFLIDVAQFTQDEVADIMEVPAGTVKSRTSRARAILKKELTSYAKEMGFMRGEK